MPSSKSKKTPQDRKPKTARYGSSWRSPLIDLDLPSGETCQVKRPGLQGLIDAGVLHSLDSLTAIVQSETIPNAEGKPLPKESTVEAIANDPKKFGQMMDQTDKIVMFVVTEPKVHNHKRPVWAEQPVWSEDGERLLQEGKQALDAENDPVFETIPIEDRDPELVYADYIDATDKMFIMSFAIGGSKDLNRFRQESAALVGGVSAGEADAPEAE